MKKEHIFLACLFTFLVLYTNRAFSQLDEAQLNINFSLPEIALIDIEPNFNNNVYFTISSGVESGNSPVFQQVSTNIWINYSSSLSSLQHSRSVVAELSQADLLDGITLYLEASNYSGSGGGQHGQSAGKIALSSQPKSIITNIGNCFTGDGINNGHSLSFSIDISDYAKVVSVENANLLVLYTITDN
ncbi:MAG: hypothetical protein R2757_22500 [Draconibacterium sp.]|jgi:hypothetical protein